MRSFILLNVVILLSQVIYSQDLQKIDSLKLQLRASDHPAEILNQISQAYLNVSPEKALEYAKLAREEAYREKDEADFGVALKNAALAYQSLGEYERSI
ncbi:MAG: hypothetical protein ABFS38_21395, partial [Bacteroidota bacterium]